MANVERRAHKTTWAMDRGRPANMKKRFTRADLRALVDHYSVDAKAEPEEEDEGPGVWDVADYKHEPWTPNDFKVFDTIDKLEEILKREEPSHDDIYATYRQLPEPRVPYLTLPVIRDMLHILSVVERPDLLSMQRYLSILDDMKHANIPITASEYTSAIHYAGRSLGVVGPDDLQSALHLWRDMEKRANIKGSHVTFNVLFDIAVKAGKFTLAELFLKELTSRGLQFYRHFRVTLLYYHGVMKNGSGVRSVYQEMVTAGDIVDTVVMNAVIAALFRAGEPSAAEHVFERMKRLDATGSLSAPSFRHGALTFSQGRTWRARRALGLALTHHGNRLKAEDEEAHKALQAWASIAPNSHTYSLLIRHHAISTGNIDRVNELLREMGYNGVPLQGSIFVVIFQGFATYGGVRYSSWTRTRLDQTWGEYLQAVKDGLDTTWMSSTSVVAALKAYRKCADGAATVRVWEEAREVWMPGVEEEEFVVKVLRGLVPGREG